MSKFEEKFKTLITADKSEIEAKRSWNVVDSAFISQLAILNSDLISLKIEKQSAEDYLESAKLNSGKLVSDRTIYLQHLIDYKNKLSNIENQITELEETIKFLTEIHEELK